MYQALAEYRPEVAWVAGISIGTIKAAPFAGNGRVADLPVRRIVGARHMVVDFTLPYGKVLHDYLA